MERSICAVFSILQPLYYICNYALSFRQYANCGSVISPVEPLILNITATQTKIHSEVYEPRGESVSNPWNMIKTIPRADLVGNARHLVPRAEESSV